LYVATAGQGRFEPLERTAQFGQLWKFKLDDGMSDSECDQPFVLSRVAAVADD
jgi:hypothetical protein